MTEQLNHLLRVLRIQYGLFILIPLLIVVAFETGFFYEGLYAVDEGMQYVLGTSGILLTIALIPGSLKLFSTIMEKYNNDLPLPDAMKLYEKWSGIRLLLLEIVFICGVFIYYLTLNNLGALCALIAVIASFFCLPSKNKVKTELEITNI